MGFDRPTPPPLPPRVPKVIGEPSDEHSSSQPPRSSSSTSSSPYVTNTLFKTKICCANEAGGRCNYGDNCIFAHGLHEIRAPGDNRSQQNHNHHRQILDTYPHFDMEEQSQSQTTDGAGSGASYRGRDAIRVNIMDHRHHHPRLTNSRPNPEHFQNQRHDSSVKTKICNSWAISGTCSYGDKCRYAHGVSDLKVVRSFPEADCPQRKGESIADQRFRRQRYLNSKDLKWRSQIYGDWIED